MRKNKIEYNKIKQNFQDYFKNKNHLRNEKNTQKGLHAAGIHTTLDILRFVVFLSHVLQSYFSKV